MREFRIAGVATNIPFIQAVSGASRFRRQPDRHRFHRYPCHSAGRRGEGTRAAAVLRQFAGPPAKRPRLRWRAVAGPVGSDTVPAPLQGTVITIEVAEGDLVRPGQQIAVIESMKMEHLVTAPLRRQGHENRGRERRDADARRAGAVSRARRGRRRRGRGRSCRRSRPHTPRSGGDRSRVTPLRLTRTARPQSSVGARPISGRRGKTSPSWSMTARSSNTDRWRSPPSAAGGNSMT